MNRLKADLYPGLSECREQAVGYYWLFSQGKFLSRIAGSGKIFKDFLVICSAVP